MFEMSFIFIAQKEYNKKGQEANLKVVNSEEDFELSFSLLGFFLFVCFSVSSV